MNQPDLHNIAPFFLLIFCVKVASAQFVSTPEIISTTQGLSQGLINDLLQDKDGFIWIATKGGLNRYDGYSFKAFTSGPQDTNTLSSNAVSNLLEDSKGRIWIGTYDGGVNIFDKKTGKFVRIVHKKGNPSGLTSNRIESSMVELPGDKILLYPQGGALSIVSLSDEGVPSVSRLIAPRGSPIAGIQKDEKGFIWIGFTDRSVYIFNPSQNRFQLLYDGHHFTSLIEKTGNYLSAKFSQGIGLMTIPQVRTSFIDSTGKLMTNFVVKSPGGTLLFDQHFPLTSGMSGCNIFDFSHAKSGDSLDAIYARNIKTDVKDQNIKCLLLDRSGSLWIGTMGHGILKYRSRNDNFHHVLPNMSVQRITIWNNGLIYVQGWRASMLLAPNGEQKNNPVAPVVKESPAYTNVLRTQQGDYWLYSYLTKKLYRYLEGLKLIASYDEPVSALPTEQLQPLLEDSKKQIWVGGANGTLARINPMTGSIQKFNLGISKFTNTTALTQTTSFYEDRQGGFWVGTEYGFARLWFSDNASAPQIKWYKNVSGDRNSLSYNYVSCFMDDPFHSDYLWICTKGGGLNRMQKSTGSFIHYTTKQGLPNDVVYGVLSDNAGNIWGSTNKGIFCLLAATKDEQPVFRTFSAGDGLQADEFNTNAFAKLLNGNLVFGGVNGLNIFDPKEALVKGYAPNVVITDIQIGSTTVSPGDETKILQQTIEQTSSITVTHLQDILTLEFSSLDFNAPLQNKYRYQLEGVDNDWIESNTRRTATYLHLSAGNYVFKVQGSNSQGIWSNKIAQLKIRVLPPWWLTWWAYLIYGLLLAAATRIYHSYQVNKAKLKSQLSYEQLETKRAKELDAIKTQLYTNITHEFRTPLTVILGMAQQVLEKPSEQFETRMNMIQRNGQNLLSLVNQMLDLSKLETGKMQLELSPGDVIQFLRYVVESFQSLAESQQKQLHFLTDVDCLYLEYDKEKLRQIISNLLSNAIKFTPEKGNIYISVIKREVTDTHSKSFLVVKVKDTGPGIPQDQQQFVFDRFYRLDNSATRKTEGAGIGLALTKELVKLMEGAITVKSPPTGAHKGSEFTVSIPFKVLPVPVTISVENSSKVFPTVPPSDFDHLALPSEYHPASVPLVLLVEDNVDVVAYIASCLPDYRLAVGKDGAEGMEIATNMVPDLIITDVMMPYMDGFELLNKIRHQEATSHIPVIVLTAKADMGSKIEGLEQGADAYLEKPFNKDELLVRIKKLLEMRDNLKQYYLKTAGILTSQSVVEMPEKMEAATVENSFVKRVREVVEQNMTDYDFTVEKLCKQVFMSHSQLHRKLEAVTGCSPNKFIRAIRFAKAKELLRNTNESIASIALDCGYSDPGYFARIFKQEQGVTPQEWRADEKNALM